MNLKKLVGSVAASLLLSSTALGQCWRDEEPAEQKPLQGIITLGIQSQFTPGPYVLPIGQARGELRYYFRDASANNVFNPYAAVGTDINFGQPIKGVADKFKLVKDGDGNVVYDNMSNDFKINNMPTFVPQIKAGVTLTNNPERGGANFALAQRFNIYNGKAHPETRLEAGLTVGFNRILFAQVNIDVSLTGKVERTNPGSAPDLPQEVTKGMASGITFGIGVRL